MLHAEGWQVNHKRVERLWRQEGLKVPQKQRNESVYGGMTDRAYGSGRRTRITCGATILWQIAPVKAMRFAC